jgi:hypothetical protein
LPSTGLGFLLLGGIVLQISRRFNDDTDSVAPSPEDRQYVWRIDPTASALPSRFSRASTDGVTVLAEQLRGLDLPPSPISITLQSEREAALARKAAGSQQATFRQPPEAVGPPPPPPPAAIAERTGSNGVVSDAVDSEEDDGQQQMLPIELGPSGPPSMNRPAAGAPSPADSRITDDVGTAREVAEAPTTMDGLPDQPLQWRIATPPEFVTGYDDAPDAIPEPQSSAGVSWQPPELAEQGPADELAAATASAEGVPDHASLVGAYLRKLRSQRGS